MGETGTGTGTETFGGLAGYPIHAKTNEMMLMMQPPRNTTSPNIWGSGPWCEPWPAPIAIPNAAAPKKASPPMQTRSMITIRIQRQGTLKKHTKLAMNTKTPTSMSIIAASE